MNNKITIDEKKEKESISIALFEPDIPQNTGTILRMADCFGLLVHIIEPCGFIFGGTHMKRAGMDYLNTVNYKMHNNYEEFLKYVEDNENRIVLATTKTYNNYLDFKYQAKDIILMGRESQGVPKELHQSIQNKVTIKMKEGKRSLNLAVSTGIIVSEALRQISVN